MRTAVLAAIAIVCIVGAIRTHRRWARMVLAVVAVPAALLVLLGILLIGCSLLPSDRSLIRRFHASHADLEQLQRMVDEDNLVGRIHANYADPHLSDARLAEYRKHMRAAGIMRLWAYGRAKPLELVVDANGWLDAGESKGYWYDPSEQQPSSASLDNSCFEIANAKKEDRFCSAVRSLGGGWWLLRYEYR